MEDISRALIQQIAASIEASEQRCETAQESIRHLDHHVATGRDAIKRSGVRLARLAARFGASAEDSGNLN